MNTIGIPHSSIPLPRPAGAIAPSPGIAPAGASLGAAASQGSFKDLLIESLKQVNSMQQDADSAVQQLLTGDDVNPAEVLTSLQKADLSFRMVMQIRNKLLQAYQEIKDVRI
jgi:flagellar hook-basal body complex protein FliE